MADSRVEAEAASLRDELNRHNRSLYHVLNRPEISDAQYDALFRQLREIEVANPDLVTPDSPTQRVGAEPAEGFVQAGLSTPCLFHAQPGQSRVQRGGRWLVAWHRRVSDGRSLPAGDPTPSNGSGPMVCELKYDGVASAVAWSDLRERRASQGRHARQR